MVIVFFFCFFPSSMFWFSTAKANTQVKKEKGLHTHCHTKVFLSCTVISAVPVRSARFLDLLGNFSHIASSFHPVFLLMRGN